MRTFEKTHPWIRFQVNLQQVGPQFWLSLGEASSKCEHLSRVPMRPDTAEKLHQLYLAKGAAATTAIEGNTLSEAEVLRAVEGKLEVPPSKEYQKQEVENIITACNAIGTQLAEGKLPPVAPDLVIAYNRRVLSQLPLPKEVAAGEYRAYSVVVGNVYRGAPAEDCPFLMERLCQWLNGDDFTAEPGMELVYAIIKAVLAHLYLAWIHPFGDGNGRTARLLEFHILLSAGVPSPAAHLLSNHYNETKVDYYRQLDQASKSGGDPLPFLRYAVEGLVDGLRKQLQFVWDQQWDVTWRNYVHELFQNQASPSDTRQRHLALDLGTRNDWVAFAAIPELSLRLARAYARKTPKTVQRDLNVLSQKGLIVRDGRRVRARRELIFAFLPLRKPNAE
jgi:Fic family protein